MTYNQVPAIAVMLLSVLTGCMNHIRLEENVPKPIACLMLLPFASPESADKESNKTGDAVSAVLGQVFLERGVHVIEVGDAQRLMRDKTASASEPAALLSQMNKKGKTLDTIITGDVEEIGWYWLADRESPVVSVRLTLWQMDRPPYRVSVRRKDLIGLATPSDALLRALRALANELPIKQGTKGCGF